MPLPWYFWACVVLGNLNLLGFLLGDAEDKQTWQCASRAALWAAACALILALNLWMRID